jgi:hypothetical protein
VHPLGVGEFIPGDAIGLTELPGVWVAGNVKNLSAFVVAAAGEGAMAAAAINADLVAEDTRRAVTAPAGPCRDGAGAGARPRASVTVTRHRCSA